MILKVEKEDLDEIVKLSEESFKEESWTKSQFEESLKNERSIFFKFVINDEIAAFLIAEDLIDSFNLLLIATKNKYKKQKIATKMLEKLENIAKNKEINKIWLEVKENNIPAINLYLKNNFKSIYIRHNYYKDGSNAIILEKSI